MAGQLASICRSEMKSVVTQSRGRHALDSLDDHWLQRGVFLEEPPRSGGHVADAVDHIHSLHDLAEYRISPTRLVGIERPVVEEIHVELAIAPRRFRGACAARR